MALESIRQERAKTTWAESLTVVGIWLVWLLVIRTFSISPLFLVSLAPLVILLGATRWNLTEALVLCFLMSILFGTLSQMPTGVMFLCLILTFFMGHMALTHLNLNAPLHSMGAIVALSLVFEILQVFFLSRTIENFRLDWILAGGVVTRSIFHGLIGQLFVIPLMKWWEGR